jgi:hypothetical protein
LARLVGLISRRKVSPASQGHSLDTLVALRRTLTGRAFKDVLSWVNLRTPKATAKCSR